LVSGDENEEKQFWGGGARTLQNRAVVEDKAAHQRNRGEDEHSVAEGIVSSLAVRHSFMFILMNQSWLVVSLTTFAWLTRSAASQPNFARKETTPTEMKKKKKPRSWVFATIFISRWPSQD
jgi:hypothetical protein